MTFDSIIFDIDGILIDTDRSFSRAVVDSVAYVSGEERFTLDEISRLKQMPGFNNDWNVAVAGACWLRFHPKLSFETFARRVEQQGGGLQGVRKLCPDFTPPYQQRITRLAQEAYGGESRCQYLYGFEPKWFRISGHWQTEKPKVEPGVLQGLDSKIGIVTGRSLAELNLAFEILDWRIPDGFVAWSDDPELDKPNPSKLINVIRNMETSHPVLLGDSRDDLELVRNYRATTQKPMAFCLIGKEDALEGCDLRFGKTREFLDFWENQNG
ncbi:MAG: HAD family hydrolase [Fidelibacterota bacterium]